MERRKCEGEIRRAIKCYPQQKQQQLHSEKVKLILPILRLAIRIKI